MKHTFKIISKVIPGRKYIKETLPKMHFFFFSNAIAYILPDKQKQVQVKNQFSVWVVHWNSLAAINPGTFKTE